MTRFREFGTTIFAEMTALAARTDSVNLGQGFPDTDGPDSVIKAAHAALASGENQYPPVDGRASLRTAIAEQRRDRYATAYDPESEVIVTTGATEAIAAGVLALCEPGDEVVMFEPYYDSYAAAVAMAGATRRTVPLRPDQGRFAFDPASLAGAITPRTRVLLLNTPHNPTGKVFSAAELRLIANVCQEHDLLAVVDEVYEYLTYDGARHIPLAAIPGMRERTLAISSAGKTFSLTGWKIGWVCGPAQLVRAVRTAKQYLTFASGAPFQNAVAIGLRNEENWIDRQRRRLQKSRDLLSDGLSAAGLRPYSCQGTYFLQTDVRDAGYDDGEEFCRHLPERTGVVAVPSTAFYDSPDIGRTLVRFAFCKREDILVEAASRLRKLSAPIPH